MPTPIASDVRAQVAAYLAGECSLETFYDRFVPATWSVDPADDQELRDLVGEVHLRVAEYTHGDWTEDELRNWLRPLVQQYRALVLLLLSARPPAVRTESTAKVTHLREEGSQPRSERRQYEVAYGK